METGTTLEQPNPRDLCKLLHTGELQTSQPISEDVNAP